VPSLGDGVFSERAAGAVAVEAPEGATAGVPEDGSGEAAAPRLDKATHSGFSVTCYPGAGEASIVRVCAGRRQMRTKPKDPERSERESRRRAASKARRYCAGNRLDRIWTFTYAEEPSLVDQVWVDVEDLRRRIVSHFGEPVPLLIVVQRGEERGRLHVHIAAGRYIEKDTLHRLWRRRGWVDLRKVKERGARAAARKAAGYIAGYLIAGTELARECGRKRYSVTKGFQPVSRQARFLTEAQARTWALGVMPGDLVDEWYSPVDPDRPPIWLGYWEDSLP
jgi:hypothetical protein